MSTKLKIIDILRKSQAFVSGEDIAEEIGISRAAVWKAVKALTEEGHDIEAISNKGYKLHEDIDTISQVGISKYIDNYEFEVLNTINSTNSYLKEIAHSKDEGYIVVSGEQTAGRGRMGRSFFSPKDTGIYMSILLKPKLTAQEGSMLTSLAAVAVCEALMDIANIKPKIKWVNDIYLNDKKLCGILSEASFNMENAQLDHVIVGIGINVYFPENFPKDIENIATAIFRYRQKDLRNRIVAAITQKFFDIYNNRRSFIDKYREYSLILGQRIYVHKANSLREATALSIDDNCRLVLAYEDNTRESLSSGEVSIKLRSNL